MNPSITPPIAADPAARERLQVPAIGLIVLSAIMICIFLLDFFLFAFGPMGEEFTRQIAHGNFPRELVPVLRWFMPAVCIFAMALNGVTLAGAIQMMRGRTWGLAMTAAIMACVPLSTSICCVAGLPIGIWAITLLVK